MTDERRRAQTAVPPLLFQAGYTPSKARGYGGFSDLRGTAINQTNYLAPSADSDCTDERHRSHLASSTCRSITHHRFEYGSHALYHNGWNDLNKMDNQ
jgi:hypothetical protein